MPKLDPNLPHLVDVEPLQPYAGNARTHSREQVELIKDAIRRCGFVGVLAYDEKGLAIGHGRRLALLEMWEAGETVMGPGKRAPLPRGRAPAVDITGLDEAERRALILVDNQAAAMAGWDPELLKAELAALEGMEFDVASIGFDEAAMAEILGDIEARTSSRGRAASGGDSDFEHTDQFGVIVICKDEAEQEEIFNRLRDQGLSVKVVVV